MNWREKPKKRWTVKKIAAIALIIILGCVAVYVFIVDPIIHYEGLELGSGVFPPYTWIANNNGQVTAVELNLFSNGTKNLTVDKVYVNDTILNQSDIAFPSGWGPTIGSSGIICLLVFPQNFIFQSGTNYSFVLQTSSGRRFTFLIPVDTAHIAQENITIANWEFFGPPDNLIDSIWVWVKNLPVRFDLVTKAWVNGTEETLGWSWLWSGADNGPSFGINSDYGNFTYVVRFETACGNIYEFTGHGFQWEYPIT